MLSSRVKKRSTSYFRHQAQRKAARDSQNEMVERQSTNQLIKVNVMETEVSCDKVLEYESPDAAEEQHV